MDADGARRWFDAYLADFVALGRGELADVRRILEYYGVPLLVSTDGGSAVLTDEEQVLAVARQQGDGMRAAGYDRSEELAGETTLLNRTCATHRGRFARLRPDGSEIAQVEATYVITDGAAGRRISGDHRPLGAVTPDRLHDLLAILLRWNPTCAPTSPTGPRV